MEFLSIPNSDLTFTRLGLGCEQLGLYNWGDVNIDDLAQAVEAAVDIGINFFDTSDVYGLGKSEENLGKFLGSQRAKVSIITKFGVRFIGSTRYFDNDPRWINKAIDLSLKRLKTDYIDMYQLHYWDGKTDLDSVFGCLSALKEKGKIRAFGFSNLAYDQLRKRSKFLNAASIFSYEYSLSYRDHENSIKELTGEKVFLAYGALGQGILSGKYSSGFQFSENDRRSSERYVNFNGETLERNFKIVDGLKDIAEKYSVNVSQVALRFVLDYLPNSAIISGVKNVTQILDNFRISDFKLEESDINFLLKLSNKHGVLQ